MTVRSICLPVALALFTLQAAASTAQAFYAPHLGRFLSRDPIGYVEGANFYPGYFAPHGQDPEGLQGNGAGGAGSSINLRQQACRKFKDWIAREIQKGTTWVEDLAACPCNLKSVCRQYGGRNPSQSITYVAPTGWSGPDDPNAWANYHPGGKYSIRKSAGVHGQQCIYDKDGSLITSGPGAGTADWSSTANWYGPGGVFGPDGHVDSDVTPYDWAQTCDGGKPGRMVNEYLRIRPVNGGKPCE